ncbi:helix-turn-helix domain-containing protein [Staphylococcus sp. IVB6181]|uniref:winged helix-turn-helix domain-containing protein n=1 Tax=Staphylococcus sp. IVB6181 TaxID=2929481 RepID=UPI0021D0AD97|nr:helix-turn-helix domain-containing protein [Staphylococcus sp. IVB6181]UXV35456.1 helix-turn-helix domain-containing protein [Staphylococcus sp. IVB6181]
MMNIKHMTKALLDEKNFQILKVTAKDPKTTKEIASLLKLPTRNLYYAIKKLIEIDALRVVEKNTIGNMIEHKYSSQHLAEIDMSINHEHDADIFDSYLKLYLVSQQNALSLLKSDLENEPEEDSVKLILNDVELTKTQWEKFQMHVGTFFKQLEDEKDGSKDTYRISLAAYKE